MKTITPLCLLMPGLICASVLTLKISAQTIDPLPAEHVANDFSKAPNDDMTLNATTAHYREDSVSSNYIGGEGASSSYRNIAIYIGFALPDLTGPVNSVTFSVNKTGNAGTVTIQLYAFVPNVSPRELKASDGIISDAHYASHVGDTDARANVRLINAAFATNATANGTITADLTSLFQEGGALAGFYGEDGKPISKNGMIWFRLNAGVFASGGNRIVVTQAQGDPNAPKLVFKTTRAPYAGHLPYPSGWAGADAADTRVAAAHSAYLKILNSQINRQRATQLPLIADAHDNSTALSASAIHYAHALAYRASLAKSGTPLDATAQETYDDFVASAKKAFLAVTAAVKSAAPGVADAQIAALLSAQGSFARLYSLLADPTGLDALDAAEQLAALGAIGDAAQAVFAAAGTPAADSRSATIADGLSVSASLLASDSRRDGWLSHADSVWAAWRQINDTIEDARGANGQWLHSTLLQASGMGSVYTDQLSEAAVNGALARHAHMAAPNGVLPDHGKTYWDEGLGHWLHAYEKLGQLHARSDMLENAAALAAYLGGQPKITVADIEGLVAACQAVAAVTAEPVALPSAIITTRMVAAGGDPVSDKLYLRTTGASAVNAFAAFDLYNQGESGHEDAGALSLYTTGSSVLLHSLGGDNSQPNRQQGAWATPSADVADFLTMTASPGAASSNITDAYAEPDDTAPKGGFTRTMEDSAGRTITHHRDIRLREIDGALLVLDTFEFTVAGDYAVGPVWHAESITEQGASHVIAQDNVQIDSDGSKATTSPVPVRFDFAASETGLSIIDATYSAGRHPQEKHFAAISAGTRAAGDFVTVLSVLRSGAVAAPMSVSVFKRYADYNDATAVRVIVGTNPFPTITSFSPAVVTVGESVIITGENLETVTSVSFGGVETTAVTVNSPNQITVTVPAGIPSMGNITVHSTTHPDNPGMSATLYTVATPPIVITTSTATFQANDQINVAGAGNPSAPTYLGYHKNSEGLPEATETGLIGNSGGANARHNGNAIMGFKLPSFTGAIDEVVFTANKLVGTTSSLTWHAQFYAFVPGYNPRDIADNGDPESLHYAGATADLNENVILISGTFTTSPPREGLVTLDLSDHFRPGGVLSGYYDDAGNPVPADGMIWFRFSPGVAMEENTQRVQLQNTIGETNSPSLVFKTKNAVNSNSLGQPPAWTGDTDSRLVAARQGYLTLFNRQINNQRDTQIELIANALANGAAVSAETIEYAYALAYRAYLAKPQTLTGDALETYTDYINHARDILYIINNALSSADPNIVAAQVEALATAQGPLVRLYRLLAGLGEIPAAQQIVFETAIGNAAAALHTTYPLAYGSFSGAALLADGLAASAAQLPDHPDKADWFAYAEAVWTDWKHVNDTMENARGGNGIWLHATLLQAAELGASHVAQLSEAGVKDSFDRFAHMLAPNGALPDYGATHWDEGLAHWLHAYEKLGQLHARSDFLGNASALTAYITEQAGLVANMAGLVEAIRATAVVSAAPAARLESIVTTRTDDLGATHYDKLVLLAGTDTSAAFALFSLRDHGAGGFEDAGALSLYTAGSSILLHSLGGENMAANRQQGVWATDASETASFLTTSNRPAANTATRWLINHKRAGIRDGQPALDPANVSGMFIRLENTGVSPVTASVTIESVIGVKADNDEVDLGVTWTDSQTIAANDTMDFASGALTLDLTDYKYLIVRWQSDQPALVQSFGISGATLIPTDAPAATTLRTTAGSHTVSAYAEQSEVAPKGGFTRVMLDAAGREIEHSRDIRLRKSDGALFVLDTFKFSEAGDYTVGPVWHAQSITETDNATYIITRDNVQIDSDDGNRAASTPSSVRFDFAASAEAGTLSIASETYDVGRHPQTEHFAATSTGARVEDEAISILTVLRPGTPAPPTSIYVQERYAEYIADGTRITVSPGDNPSLAGFSPEEITIGGTVTLTGENFASVTSVKFGNVEAPSGTWIIVDSYRIVATVPSGIPETGYVTVSSGLYSSSSVLPYSIAHSPADLQPLTDKTVANGKNLVLEARATGNPAPDYQWQVSTDGGATWSDIDGATETTLTVQGVTSDMNGWQYRYAATNHAGTQTSNAITLTVRDTWFNNPEALAIDQAGNIYIADSGAHVIYSISNDGKVNTFTGSINTSGTASGAKSATRLTSPSGVSIAPGKTLRFTDLTQRVRIAGGDGSTSVFVGSASQAGFADGYGTAASFNNPGAIVTDSNGTSYVVDTGNHAIRRVSIDTALGGNVTTIAGTGTAGAADAAIGTQASFNSPAGLILDETAQVLYVADTGNHVIRIIDLANSNYPVTRYAGQFGVAGSTDAADPAQALFDSPRGLALDGGDLYVADTGNSTIRMIQEDGQMATIAGTAGNHNYLEGTGAGAAFRHPVAIAIDAAGDLYVLDTGNATLRKIAQDGAVSTPALSSYWTPEPPPASPTSGGGAPTLWYLLGLLALGGAHVLRRTR